MNVVLMNMVFRRDLDLLLFLCICTEMLAFEKLQFFFVNFSIFFFFFFLKNVKKKLHLMLCEWGLGDWGDIVK